MKAKEKSKYQKPELQKVEKMTFMFEAFKGKSKIGCRQCSGCHGCRQKTNKNAPDGHCKIHRQNELVSSIYRQT